MHSVDDAREVWTFRKLRQSWRSAGSGPAKTRELTVRRPGPWMLLAHAWRKNSRKAARGQENPHHCPSRVDQIWQNNYATRYRCKQRSLCPGGGGALDHLNLAACMAASDNGATRRHPEPCGHPPQTSIEVPNQPSTFPMPQLRTPGLLLPPVAQPAITASCQRSWCRPSSPSGSRPQGFSWTP